jgi:hypothetical protein
MVSLLKSLVAATLLVTVLTGCGPSEFELQATAVAAAAATETADPCSSTKVTTYGTRIERELEVYEGILDIAGSTSRIALAGPRQELQKQRFVVKDIETPACLTEYHERVIAMMKMQELGFEFFVSDTSDAGRKLAFVTSSLADDRFEGVKKALPELLAGRVPVLPTEEESTPDDAD